MRIGGLDIETTGLHADKGDRIIEIALLEYDLASKTLMDTYVQRIHPGRPIDPKAQEVHGISITDLVGCPSWEDVAEEVSRRLARLDLLVAHNMAFDGPFVGLELARVGIALPSVEVFCTMEEGRWATPLGKTPSLKELCFAVNVPYDDAAAHAAEYDVDRMMRCLMRGVERGFYVLPEVPRKTETEEAA